MRAKLIIEGREFPIDINDPELQKILAPKPKHTGYERVKSQNTYYCEVPEGEMAKMYDVRDVADEACYNAANYYSDKTVAENNARADKLMRQLRRFAVEHREKEMNWDSMDNLKWNISYDHYGKRLMTESIRVTPEAFSIYFESKEKAQLAIDTFRDELTWYFTEYKDSL